MRVLDLFSGTGGWSRAFMERGHHVTRIDNDPQFSDVPGTTIMSVLDVGASWPTGYWDVVLASPPCQAFSLAAKSTHMQAVSQCKYCSGRVVRRGEEWFHDDVTAEHCLRGNPTYHKVGMAFLEPKTEWGRTSVQLVDRVGDIIAQVQPKFWWMENPNGGMIHFVPPEIPRVQVTYCQYGETRMKLTNLWGNWPSTWSPRPRCKNGDPCHERAPRGAMTGTRAIKGARDRAIVPYQLSLEVCLACEAAGL